MEEEPTDWFAFSCNLMKKICIQIISRVISPIIQAAFPIIGAAETMEEAVRQSTLILLTPLHPEIEIAIESPGYTQSYIFGLHFLRFAPVSVAEYLCFCVQIIYNIL